MKNYKVVFAQKNCPEIWEDSIPEPGPTDVLIKTEISMISTGTELTSLEANVDMNTVWKNDIVFPKFPGYSNVGTIVQVGRDVDESLIGKKVLSDCRHQKYVIKHANDVLILPDNVDSEQAVFGTLACVAMASIRAAEIRSGDTVVVFGAGLVGQLVARFAKIAGALNIFVTDVSDHRLDMIPNDTCFIKVNSTKEDILDALTKYGAKEKARVVFEVTSVPSLVEKELNCLCKLGRLVVTSSPKGKSTIDLEYCCRQGLTIIGAHNYAIHSPIAIPHSPWTRAADTAYFLNLLSKEQICIKNLVSHKTNYKDSPEAYKMLMKDRTQAMGVLIDWRD